MRDLWYLVLNKILLVWSFLPVMAICAPDRFSSIQCEDGAPNKWLPVKGEVYASFFHIRLGGYIINLFDVCICSDKNKFDSLCKRVKVIKLMSIDMLVRQEYSEEKFDQIEREYRKHIQLISIDGLKIEKEELEYRIKYYTEILKKIAGKLKMLHSVAFMVTPTVFTYILSMDKVGIGKFAFSGIMWVNFYLLLNAFLLLFQFYSLENRNYSSFRDLRETQRKQRESVIQKYMDWQYIKPVHKRYTSFVGIYRDIINAIILINVPYIIFRFASGV